MPNTTPLPPYEEEAIERLLADRATALITWLLGSVACVPEAEKALAHRWRAGVVSLLREYRKHDKYPVITVAPLPDQEVRVLAHGPGEE